MRHCDLHFNFKYYYMVVRLKPVGIKWEDSKNTISSQSNKSVWFKGINCTLVRPSHHTEILTFLS